MPWTELLDSRFLPGRWITPSLLLALRDNLVSAFRGEPGAPRLTLGAIERIEAGDFTKVRQLNEVSATFSPAELFHHDFIQFGSVRLFFQFNIVGANGSAAVTRLRQEASTVLAQVEDPGPFESVSIDINVQPGDRISITLNGGSDQPETTAILRSVRLRTSGANIWPLTASGMDALPDA